MRIKTRELFNSPHPIKKMQNGKFSNGNQVKKQNIPEGNGKHRYLTKMLYIYTYEFRKTSKY